VSWPLWTMIASTFHVFPPTRVKVMVIVRCLPWLNVTEVIPHQKTNTVRRDRRLFYIPRNGSDIVFLAVLSSFHIHWFRSFFEDQLGVKDGCHRRVRHVDIHRGGSVVAIPDAFRHYERSSRSQGENLGLGVSQYR
jgi:hypothetical protein